MNRESWRRLRVALPALFLLALPLLAAPEQRALLDLVVNQLPHGTVQVVLREGDALVEAAALQRAGLRFGGRREDRAGIEHVSLASLAPSIAWEVDEEALALRLTAEPALFETQVVDLRLGPPPGIVYSADPSAFLNYAATSSNLETLDIFGEAGVSLGNRLLAASFSQREGRGFLRHSTSLSLDDRERLRRIVIGDVFANTRSPLGGALPLAGVSVLKDLGLDPYLIRSPIPDVQGELLTPSTVEVYVNGLLVRRETLPPGRFELRDIPVATGRGEARVVIRDAFGRERVLSSPYYFAAGLLARGLSEYGYSLGWRRENEGVESFDYGAPAFLGRHRYGVHDRLTLGGTLEAAERLVSGGPSVAFRLPYGELELAAALSDEAGEEGSAGFAAYSFSGRRFGFGATLRRMSPRFANLGLPAALDRPLLERRLFFGLSAGQRLGWTLELGDQDFRDRPDRELVRLGANLRLTQRATLLLLATRQRQDGPPEPGFGDQLALGLSYFLGRNTTGKLYGSAGDGEDRAGVEVQKSLPVGTGLGYRLTADRVADRREVTGEVQYQNSYGRYTLERLDVAGQEVTNLHAAGALVWIGGGAHLTRPVQDSYALIRVPGVPGVRGYLSNQEVGRTNRQGDLLVPNLLAYFGNRLSIADEDVPLEYTVAERERVVAPPIRGGALATFPVSRLRAARGTLVVLTGGPDQARRQVPGAGRLVVTAGGVEIASPVGRAGEFYLENVPAGEHPAVLEWDGGACAFRLAMPAAAVPLVSLGEVACAAEAWK